MKMKLEGKRKTEIALLSVFLICLFVSCLTTTAVTTMPSPIYPSTVELGEKFQINIIFEYPFESDCLYGESIWIYYEVAPNPVNVYANLLTVSIADLEGFPQPTSVLVEFDTATLSCQVNDTFSFIVKAKRGQTFDDGDTINYLGMTTSALHKITIVESEKVSLSAVSAIAPLLVLSVVVLIRKKRK